MKDYQQKVLRFENTDLNSIKPRITQNVRLTHAAMGLVTESIELLELPLNDYREQSIAELGDLMFYVSQACDVLSLDFSLVINSMGAQLKYAEVMEANDINAFKRNICSCAGNVLDSVKKCIYYGAVIEKDTIYTYLSKLVMFIKLACRYFNTDLNTVMCINYSKLSVRYGDKFSEDSAINRDLEAEDKALTNSQFAKEIRDGM